MCPAPGNTIDATPRSRAMLVISSGALYSSSSETRDLATMLAGTSTTYEASFTNGADILDLVASNALFTKAPISRSSKDWVEITVDGDNVKAHVNGALVADVNDSGSQVVGRGLEFGVGSKSHSQRNTDGNFDRLKVSVPDP